MSRKAWLWLLAWFLFLLLMWWVFGRLARGQAGSQVPTSPTTQTDGTFNGRFWALANHLTKLTYVDGVTAGLVYAGLAADHAGSKACGDLAVRFGNLSEHLTKGQIIHRVDEFYWQRDNLPIPIFIALKIVADRVTGVSEKDIKAETARYRRVASEGK